MTTWQDVLHRAGYPTTAVVLDFETYFDKDYTLKKMTAVEYVCDSRFEITGLGVQQIGYKTAFLPGPDQTKDWLLALNTEHGPALSDYTIVCQNAKFDCLILKEHFGIAPKYTVDLVDLDRMWDARASHRLKNMASRWNTPALKGDTNQFKGYRYGDMTPEMQEALAEYCKNDVDIEAHILQKLLPLIPIPQIELPLATQTLRLFLEPQIGVDVELGEKLKREMRLEVLMPRLELRKLGVPASKTSISKNKKFVELLGRYTDVPMKQGKNGLIPALAKDDEGLRELLNDSEPEVRLLAEARQKIKSWPLHIARVDRLMNQAKVRDGLIGVPLNFYGAHTGRWSGGEKTNLQNLGGAGRGGSGTHPLIQQIRHMLVAPPGYVFGVNDYKQIEARMLAWMAGQKDLVQGFANGEDIYSDFMRETFGWHVRKPDKKTDPPPVKKLLTIRRGFGKDAILGCGYGMGNNRFYDRCWANDDLRPMFHSGQYDWDFIDKLIKTYRRKYSKIPEFWRSLEKSWRFVTKFANESVTHPTTPLGFMHKDGATFINLPSGRFLRYSHARVKRDNRLSYRWNSNIWGGFLTENVVQAASRDVMGEALLRLDAAGFNIVLHVHDEIICLFEKDRAEEDLEEMSRIMSIVPDWATGLPVAVDAKLCERYEK